MIQNIKRKKILITLDGGGYENEAKMLLKQIGGGLELIFATGSDNEWKDNNHEYEGTIYYFPSLLRKLEPSRIRVIPRLLKSLIISFRVLRKERPDVIIGVASPLCIPLFVIGFLLGNRRVFIESITRTDRISLTGKILLATKLANRFYVQWPDLSKKYPGTIYKGTLA